MLTVYGIPNCDKCRAARRWLKSNAVDHAFHDVRADGLDRDTIAAWMGQSDWKTLLNTRSTTWRALDDHDKADLDDDKALRLILAYPTLLKRPVLEHADGIEVGFSADRYAEIPGLR